MSKPVIISIVMVIALFWALIFNKVRTAPTTTRVPVPTKVDTTTKISLAQMSTHKDSASCWMAVDGKVYDVTNYISQHPDGNSILRGCGIDATTMYAQVRKHNGRATQILPEFQIGILN